MNDPAQLPLETLVGRMAQLQAAVRAALAAGDAQGALVSETERGELIRSLFEGDHGLSSKQLAEFATALLQVQDELAAEAAQARSRLESEAAQLRGAGRGVSAYLDTAGLSVGNGGAQR